MKAVSMAKPGDLRLNLRYLHRGAIQTHCVTLNVDSTLEIWTPTPPLLTSTRGTKKIRESNMKT